MTGKRDWRDRAEDALVPVIAAPVIAYYCAKMAVALFRLAWYQQRRSTWEEEHGKRD